MPRITALSTLAYAGHPPTVALEEIQARGFRAVELVHAVPHCRHLEPGAAATEAMRAMLRAVFLQPIGLDYCRGVSDDGAADERLRHVIRQCRSLGIVKLNMDPRGTRGERGGRDGIDAAARAIGELADEAFDNGVRLTVDAPRRGGLLETVERTAAFFARVGSEHVGIAIDSRHAPDGDLDELWRVAGARIWHVRVHDPAGAGGPAIDRLGGWLDGNGYRGNVTAAFEYAGGSAKEIGSKVDEALGRLVSAGWQLPKTARAG